MKKYTIDELVKMDDKELNSIKKELQQFGVIEERKLEKCNEIFELQKNIPDKYFLEGGTE